MPEARFVQIHTLHGYAAALLNRDDSGLAKRLPYGGVMRTRISSQCLKRHWRMTKDAHDLQDVDGAEESVRSRRLVEKRLSRAVEGDVAPEVIAAVQEEFLKAIYGKDAKNIQKRQPLLFGAPELRCLESAFTEIARNAADAKDAAAKAGAFCAEKRFRDAMKQMRAQTVMPGGLTAALFGRMVTSDPEANIDAPVHVAHAFTVHEEESESDYFAVVDDLKAPDEEQGADHIGESELTSGLFYGYVALDVPGLVSNTTGAERAAWLDSDRAIAAEVTRRLVHLIAEVSPGAKLGSTAPYGYAAVCLVEIGDRQPRSLAEAFREPCRPNVAAAERAMRDRLHALDDAYATGEARRFMSLSNDAAFGGAERLSLPELAGWTAAAVQAGSV